MIPIVLIAGPTASGKSALAMELAETFGGVVVNADSMQVYRELRILTNRPTMEDEARVPHRLYGFRAAAEPYSIALWLEDVARELAPAEAMGWLPIIVGGTGLYFTALTEGLSAIPVIPVAIRDAVRARAALQPARALHAELARHDPETAAKVRPTDTQRIARALEVWEATGRPLAHWQGSRQPPLVPLTNAFPIVLDDDRAALYARCDARFDWMVGNGALTEINMLNALGLSPDLPAMRAVGVPELLEFATSRMSLNMSVNEAKADTRQYAKRQQTWIKRNFITWNMRNTHEHERIKRELNIYLRDRLTDRQ